jgi:hypothetical protein
MMRIADMTIVQEPMRKSDIVRQHVANGNYKKALAIVKGFRLGVVKEDLCKMSLAYECMLRPAFFAQLGIDPDAAITEGIKALTTHYGRR